MFKLCIADRIYLFGLFRVEEFDSMAKLEVYRGQLDRGTITWVMGEPIPKRTHHSVNG